MHVDVQRRPAVDPATRQTELLADLARAQRLARLLDTQFAIGPVKFGIDPLADLVPIVGDTVMLLAGLYPIYVARKHGLGKRIERRMVFNLAVEWVGGIVPGVGAVIDWAFKANLRNFRLLEKAAAVRGD